MTVKELINELMKYPEDMRVYVEIPRRKAYQPLYELSVRKSIYWDIKTDNYVDIVSLLRGKLFR